MKHPVLLYIAILLFSVTACEKDEEAAVKENELILGAILGFDENVGVGHKYGIYTALEEIRDGGGVAGYELSTDMRSSQRLYFDSRAKQAEAVAKDIAKDFSSNLLGFITSSSTTSQAVALEVGEPNHLATISGYSTSSANTGLSSYFHRTAPSDKYAIDVFLKKAQDYGIKKVAIAVERGDLFSETYAEDLRVVFEAAGITITNEVFFNPSEVDYFSKLQTLYQGEPDIVLASMLFITPDFFTQLHDNMDLLDLEADDLHFMLISKSDDVLEIAGFDFLVGVGANGIPRVFTVEGGPNRSSASYKSFDEKIHAYFDTAPTSYSSNFYDIVFIYALAIEKAVNEGHSKSDIEAFRMAINKNIREVTNPEGTVVTPADGWAKMKTVLKNGAVNFEGASGNCNIDEFGDITSFYDIHYIERNASGKLYYKLLENTSATK